jgi:retinol dehydrogenase-12
MKHMIVANGSQKITVQPWGRFVAIRDDLAAGAKSEAEGGTGVAEKFWTWTEEQVKAYL